MAMLVLSDLLDEEPFTTNWAAALTTCFAVCEPYINDMRERGSAPRYWGHFEQLARRAAEKIGLPLEPLNANLAPPAAAKPLDQPMD